MSHKEELTQRADNLQKEIQELSKTFELKKEEFLKVQGALEMLQILENEKTSKETWRFNHQKSKPKNIQTNVQREGSSLLPQVRKSFCGLGGWQDKLNLLYL